MVHLSIELSEEALASMRHAPTEFAQEMRLAAAAKWYELRRVSQERAAAIAGLSRAEFLAALGPLGVSPFQATAEELIEEATRGETWVANASPLIVLAKIGRLTLLEQLSPGVLVPEPVAREILDGPPADPARMAIEGGWGSRITPGAIPTQLLEWGLGSGETAVLAVVMANAPSVAVLDDAAARACARTLGIRVIGTLGVVLQAKKRGIIPSASDILHGMRLAGLYLDDRVVLPALRQVGE